MHGCPMYCIFIQKETYIPFYVRRGAVYLGAYNEEEAAARAYDLAALKYWGPTTYTNFPVRIFVHPGYVVHVYVYTARLYITELLPLMCMCMCMQTGG